QVQRAERVDLDSAKRALTLLEVDEFGFDDLDRKILTTLIEHYDGGPAGIKALAVAVGEDRGTLEDLYEPYLIQEGFLQRTPRGRVATRPAYPGHATELAREQGRELEVVFVFGGDGTMREAAAGLLGSPAALGLIPGGTVNVLGLSLGLPREPVAAAGFLTG